MIVLGVVLGASSRVYAQENATTQARVEFGAGVEAFEAEQYEVALRHFLAAWQLRPHPTVRVNLASCFAKLGRFAPSVLHYNAYLADRSVQLSRAARREVQAALAEIEPRVGTVDVTVTPGDARLTVDGEEPEARDGSRLYLVAGTHRIVATAPGHREMSRIIEVSGRSSQSLDLELPEAASTAPPPREPSPDEPLSGPEGTDEERPPTETSEEPIGTDEAPAGEAPSDRGGSGRTIARWSLFGVAGIAAVSATVLGVMALGAYDDFDAGANRIEDHDYANEAERAQIDRTARDDADRASSLALWADVSIGVAVVAAGAGTYLWLTTPSSTDGEEASAPLRVAGAPIPGGGAVAVSGTF